MKKFFLKISMICFPVLVTLISVNYYVDPANLFSGGKYEKGIANYLCEGYNVTNIYNYDERLLQKYFIECLKIKPDILVIGSSRSMLIGSDLFSNKIINNGVSGASVEDFLAIYNFYQKRKFKPKTIILGLDPWLLNDNSGQTLWKSIADNYFEMLKNIGLKKYMPRNGEGIEFLQNEINKKMQIVSFNYFQQSLSMISTKTNYYPTKELVNDTFTKHTDGSICYDNNYRYADSISVTNSAKAFINANPLYSLGSFSNLSSRNKEIFEKFVLYLNEQNINLIFFLAPYHPIVYDYFKINAKYKIVLQTEKYYKELAKKYNLKLLGSFNPHIFKLKNIDFYDGMHCNVNAIKTIFATNRNNE